ncbi:hypothetical protein [Jatrophihabitans sp.]|uniref:hypothetical protein n=1 Tax=Jatrophihabitans sp. TaxID=1932789 RepID=UPI0030C74C41|nr:hypothetical protein [Jatrophihabitans sp.]
MPNQNYCSHGLVQQVKLGFHTNEQGYQICNGCGLPTFESVQRAGGLLVHSDQTVVSEPGVIASPRVVGSVLLGIALAVVGVVVGLRMALKATVVPCPDGASFPSGTTDLRCFAHHHAGDGTAIVVVSLMLAILIILAGVVANAVLADPPGRR